MARAATAALALRSVLRRSRVRAGHPEGRPAGRPRDRGGRQPRIHASRSTLATYLAGTSRSARHPGARGGFHAGRVAPPKLRRTSDVKRTIAFIAERAGSYRIELRAPSVAEAAQQGGSQSENGTYELTLVERLSFDERMKAQPRQDRYASPAIEALRKQIVAGDSSTESFWQRVAQSGTPLVEPIEGETKRTRVTFLWRATAPDAERDGARFVH